MLLRNELGVEFEVMIFGKITYLASVCSNPAGTRRLSDVILWLIFGRDVRLPNSDQNTTSDWRQVFDVSL